MLVLSRQRDESIIIGDNIVITVVDIRGDKVRLGIQAPKDVTVHRQEVYEAIQREQAEQAQVLKKQQEELEKQQRELENQQRELEKQKRELEDQQGK